MAKKSISTISLLLSLALLLAACSSSNSSGSTSTGSSNGATNANKPQETTTEVVDKGGNLSYALATSPDSLDPHRSGLAVAVRVLRTLYDSLVVQLSDGTIHPWLATEWSISEDGKSYTFKLRDDVKFHDGTPFNAEAVKYNYDRILDPATKAANSAALLRPYESSEVVDEFTIKINLSTPSQAFLGNLSQALLGIVSPTAAEKYGEQFVKNPVGSGPFEFESWQENAQIVVKRNDQYAWAPDIVSNKGVAYLDSIAFHIVPEEATRIGSVQSGQLLAAETIPPQNIASFQSDPNSQVFSVNTVGLPYTLFFNLEHEPWNDLKVRQAVQAAVDVTSIVQTLYLGTYEQAWSPLSPGILGYDPSLENSIVPDIDKANRLLDESGWLKGTDGIREKDGKKLTLKYVDGSPNREKRNDIAVIIQQQLKAVGIDVQIEITKDVRTVVYTNYDYDLYGNSMVNTDPNALYSIYHSYPADGPKSLSKLSDPHIDQLLEQGLVEGDLEKRANIYKEIQHYIIDNAIILPIYVFPYTVGAHSSVKDLVFDYLGYPIFNDVYIAP